MYPFIKYSMHHFSFQKFKFCRKEYFGFLLKASMTFVKNISPVIIKKIKKIIFWYFVIEMISMTFLSKSKCMYSVLFYGVPVHRSRTIIFKHTQAARGVTYLWYSQGLSSPPYTDTGMSHQCSDRCPHSYTASSWYTRSHLQFNRERRKLKWY